MAGGSAARLSDRGKAGKPYRSKHSGITTPAELDGMRRVDAVYQDGPDAITAHVDRSLTGSVPVWLDRARAAIELRKEMFGTSRRSCPRPSRPRANRPPAG